jgi:hypothetical protein
MAYVRQQAKDSDARKQELTRLGGMKAGSMKPVFFCRSCTCVFDLHRDLPTSICTSCTRGIEVSECRLEAFVRTSVYMQAYEHVHLRFCKGVASVLLMYIWRHKSLYMYGVVFAARHVRGRGAITTHKRR